MSSTITTFWPGSIWKPRRSLKAPPFALDVQRRHLQVPRGLIAGDDAADGRRDGDVDRADGGDDLLRQGLAQPLAAVGVHEDQVLLQEDRAVQAGGQHEMAFAQGAGGSELVEDVSKASLRSRKLMRSTNGAGSPWTPCPRR
jgi:hypothetical protein